MTDTELDELKDENEKWKAGVLETRRGWIEDAKRSVAFAEEQISFWQIDLDEAQKNLKWCEDALEAWTK